jgi:hypothetical protein
MGLCSRLFGVLVCSLSLAACGGDGDGGGGSGGSGGTGGTGGDGQTSTVSGKVVITGESGTPVAGVTVSVSGTSLSTTSDAEGRFTLQDVPNGDRFFVTAANDHWGFVDYWAVPDETSGDVILGVLPDSEIALLGAALGRTLRDDDGAVDVYFYEGAQGGETASISASSDPPFTFDLSDAPVVQAELIVKDGVGDLIFTSVDPSDGITATVTGVSGTTECFVDETPGIRYPILAESITLVYAYCQ